MAFPVTVEMSPGFVGGGVGVVSGVGGAPGVVRAGVPGPPPLDGGDGNGAGCGRGAGCCYCS